RMAQQRRAMLINSNRKWYALLAKVSQMAFVIAPSLLTRLHRTFRRLAWQRPRQLRSSPGFPTLYRSPETPLPSAPLVRVLETVDLSQSNVEHFLERAEVPSQKSEPHNA